MATAGEERSVSHALGIVVPVGLAALAYSFFYDLWRLPPRLPGTVGLVLGGDVLPLLLVPLAVVRFGLGRPASEFGWAWPGMRRFGGATLGAWLAMLPFVVVLAQRPEFQAAYPSPAFPPARAHLLGLALLALLHHLPQLLATEFCVRGFLLFPLARRLGLPLALLATGLPYVLAHATKPPLELLQAAWGAVVFGVAAWRTGSIAPAAAAHWLVAVSMDLLCLQATGRF